MSTPRRSHDATRPPQNYSPTQDIDVHTRKRLQHTTTYFPGAHNFAIYGGEFSHVEGDQYISHHRNEDASVLLVRLICKEKKLKWKLISMILILDNSSKTALYSSCMLWFWYGTQIISKGLCQGYKGEGACRDWEVGNHFWAWKSLRVLDVWHGWNW